MSVSVGVYKLCLRGTLDGIFSRCWIGSERGSSHLWHLYQRALKLKLLHQGFTSSLQARVSRDLVSRLMNSKTLILDVSGLVSR